MAIELRHRRGTVSENNAFTGAAGEVVVDTTNNRLRLHDGATAGGHPIGDYVNVKDYGAKGDGVTDDTAAIQSVYDLADDVTVFIPDGDYKISSTISIKKDTVCNGTLTSLGLSAGTALVSVDASVKVKGLTVVGIAADKTNGCIGISIPDADGRNSFFENCVSTGFETGILARTYLLHFQNCRATTNNTNVSLSINTSGGLSEINAITFVGGIYWGATDYCMVIGDDRVEASTVHGWNIGIYGCDFDNAPMKIGNVGSVKISNCYFEAPTSTNYPSDSEKCIVTSGTLGSVRTIDIDTCYFNNTKYAVYCNTQPKTISVKNCTMNSITVCGLYAIDSIYQCVLKNNQTTGSFSNGTEFHTACRSGVTGAVLSNYITDKVNGSQFDLQEPPTAIEGARYSNTAGRIYYRVNDTTSFRTYQTPTTGIVGTKSGSVITLTTISDGYNFNAGDGLDINGTINYIRVINYETGVITTDEFTVSGAVTIGQIATVWGGNTTALANKIEIVNAYNTSAGDLLTLGGRLSAVDNLKVYAHKFANTSTAGVGAVLKLYGVARNASDVNLTEWFNTYYRPISDNVMALGGASNRWTTVYAATGTINTSDDRDKTYIDITDVEKQVALELKANMKKFKFNDAIETKGSDNARIHYGASAQTVKSIFEKHGLNPFEYALLCYDEWDDEYEQNVIQEPEFDEDGNIIKDGIYENGALITKAGNKYGLRYEELLAFIISAI